MATRDELLALADRVEAATGPGRELDAEIARAIGWGCVMRDPEAGREWICWRKHYRYGDWIMLPHYTFSLDAALTLVPDGWRWMVGHAESQYAAVLAHDTEEGVMRPLKPAPEAVAATPALALVAASLRAIAEEPIP